MRDQDEDDEKEREEEEKMADAYIQEVYEKYRSMEREEEEEEMRSAKARYRVTYREQRILRDEDQSESDGSRLHFLSNDDKEEGKEKVSKNVQNYCVSLSKGAKIVDISKQRKNEKDRVECHEGRYPEEEIEREQEKVAIIGRLSSTTETPQQRLERIREIKINVSAFKLREGLNIEGVSSEVIGASTELRRTMAAEALPHRGPPDQVPRPKWGTKKYLYIPGTGSVMVGETNRRREYSRNDSNSNNQVQLVSALKQVDERRVQSDETMSPEENRREDWVAAEEDSVPVPAETPEQRMIRPGKSKVCQAVDALKRKTNLKRGDRVSRKRIQAKGEVPTRTNKTGSLPPVEQVSKSGTSKKVLESEDQDSQLERAQRRRERLLNNSRRYRKRLLERMTEEEKAEYNWKHSEKARKRLSRMTEEEKEKLRERQYISKLSKNAEMTKEEIEVQIKNWRQRRRILPEERRQRNLERNRARQNAHHAARRAEYLSSEEYKRRLVPCKNRYTSETPEARRRRLQRTKIYCAAKQLKSNLEKSGATQEEIEKKVAELRERMKAEPLPPLDQISKYLPQPCRIQDADEKRKIKRRRNRVKVPKPDPDDHNLSSFFLPRKMKKVVHTEIKCPFCLWVRQIVSYPSFSKHLQSCAASLPEPVSELLCSLCNTWSCPYSSSSDIQKFMEHIVPCQEMHVDNPIPWRHSFLKCNLCSEESESPYILFPNFARHILRYHQHSHGCSQCPVRFRHYSNILQHWRIHHKELLPNTRPMDRYHRMPEGIKVPLPYIPWWCPVPKCYQEFPDEDSRDLHLSNCQEQGQQLQEKNKSCSTCERKYFSDEELLMHCASVHGLLGVDHFQCNICGKLLRHQGSLKLHMRSHASSDTASRTPSKEIIAEKEKYQGCCELCGKIVAKKFNLPDHLARVHGIGDFKCDVEECSKVYARIEHLENHKKFVHEGVKRPRTHFCQFCGKGFTQASKLSSHEESVHLNTGNRPYKCNLCEKTFSSKNYVYYHVTYTHKIKGKDRSSAYSKLDSAPKE